MEKAFNAAVNSVNDEVVPVSAEDNA
jgi:hypothetical protein